MSTATQQKPQQQTTEAPTGSLLDGMIDKNMLAQVTRLGSISDEGASLIAQQDVNRIQRALHTAIAVKQVKAALTPMLMEKFIVPLIGTNLGFDSDRPNDKHKEQYSVEVIKECVVEALLKGFLLTGNEWMILAGGFYGQQAGWKRKLLEIPGVTNVEPIPGVPLFANGKTTCRVVINLRLNGKPWTLKDSTGQPGRVFPIRVNSGMGDEAIQGKALARAYKAAFFELSGLIEDDEDAPDAKDVGVTVASSPTPAALTNQAPQLQPGEVPNDDAPEDEDEHAMRIIDKINALCSRHKIPENAIASYIRDACGKLKALARLSADEGRKVLVAVSALVEDEAQREREAGQ